MGTIFSHDQRQYSRWQASFRRSRGQALGDAALEAGIMSLAQMFPGNVTRAVMA